MPEMSNGAVIHSIAKRYMTDRIYTRIGLILVACNPYKRIDIDIEVNMSHVITM